RIDEDRLAVDPQQGKPSLLARKNPELIAVSEIRSRLPWRECIGLPACIGRVQQIVSWHDLPGADRAVIGEQHAEPAVGLLRIKPAGSGAAFAFPKGVVLLIAGLTAVAFLVEGAILDWSALLITSENIVPAPQGGVGY